MLDIFLLCGKNMKKLCGLIVCCLFCGSISAQVKVGNTIFEKMYFYQDTLYQDSVKQFQVIFTCKQPLRFIRYDAPPYIRIDLPAAPLEVNQKYSVPLWISAHRIKKVGHFQTLVKLYTNEAQENEKVLYVSGIVRPYPKKYTLQELAYLPQIKVYPNPYQVGKVKRGSKVEVAFTVENTGAAPLQILNTKTECGCTEWQVDTTAILPKQKRYIRFRLDTQDLERISSEIWLWTDAANLPEIKLRIEGEIF